MSLEQIAKVLTEHGQFGFDLAQGVWECLCDHPLSIDGDLNEKHIAHQAAMLAPLIAAAKAEALREAADATDDTDMFAVGWRDRQLLRARADLLEAETDPEGRALVQAIHDRKAKA